jgi:RNA recognition motif-containing protein
MKPGVPEENIKATLMVRGLSGLTLEDIETSFSRFGKLKEVRMVKDRFTGDFKDFAFVEFENEDDADKVIFLSLNEAIRVSGRPVNVVKSKDRRPEITVHENKEKQENPGRIGKIPEKEQTCINTESHESVGEIFLSTSIGKSMKNKNEFVEMWNERLKKGISICFKCNKWFDTVELGKLHEICHK